MKDLPQFRKRDFDAVYEFMEHVLTRNEDTSLHELIPYDDGHFRAIFKIDYFLIAEDRTEPSKSQWSTLKKKLKRHDDRIFVFKEHGFVACDDNTCGYIDFGFFQHG